MAPSIYSEERQQCIWRRVQTHGRVSVRELADEFSVTAETIRRDLAALERAGAVRRVHGGAISSHHLVFEPSLEDRTRQMADEKARIASAARAELRRGAPVFIDAGTTTAQLVERPDDLEFTAVTNSVPIALALTRWPRVTVMTLGGRVRAETLAEVDDWALRSLAELRVEIAFVAANAVSLDRGLGTPDPSEAAVKRAVCAAADRVVLLVDHTKFDAESMLTYGRLSEVDAIVTGTELDDERARAIRAMGIELVLA